MKLQKKVQSGLLLVFLVLFALMAIVTDWTFLRQLHRSERQTAAAEAQRAVRVVQLELENLTRIVRDYAEWDETVQFIQEGNAAYRASSWEAATLANLEIAVELLYRPEGRFFDGVTVSEDGKSTGKASEGQVAVFGELAAKVAADPTARTRIAGLRLLEGRPCLFTCLPVLGTAAVGSPRGSLVAVRWFDESLRTRLEAVVGYPTRLVLAGVQDADDEDGFAPAEGGSQVWIAPRSATVLAVRVPLAGFDGGPFAMVELELGRASLAEACKVRALLLGQLAVATLLVGVLIDGLIRWQVIGRLEQLSAGLRVVGSTGRLETRLPATGDDEIGNLAHGINGMLQGIAQHAAEKENARNERESLQAQLLHAQKMEAVGQFAGGIAHDFNNCLTSVSGWINLTKSDLPREHPCQENLALAAEAAHHAASVVKQLLAFSRRGGAVLTPVHLGELLSESLVLFRSGLPRSIELHLHAEGGDDQVLADRTQLLQVMMNLLSNARDAMGNAGTLTLTLGEVHLPDPRWPSAAPAAPGTFVRLSVRDTGPGIAPEHLARIFEPFFTTKPASKGTGLGLAVVQSVVARHNGFVAVETRLGAGTVFEILLPLHQPGPEPPAVPAPLAGPFRVLLAEDDPNVTHVLTAALNRRGWTVTPKPDGEAAWEVFRAEPGAFDVVLTDLTMPRLTGMQLAERILDSEQKVPIVLMTAFGSTLDPHQVQEAGFAAVLTKPMMVDEVLATLARAAEEAKGRAGAQ